MMKKKKRRRLSFEWLADLFGDMVEAIMEGIFK